MKKFFKRESSSVPDQTDPNMAVLIEKIQQQLVVLEKKLDTLISQSSERPFEGKHYSKPSQRFDRSRRKDRGNQRNSYREKSFTQAICADCNKECDVPFKPTGDRPVYCKECFSKRNAGSSFKGKYDKAPRKGDFSQRRHFDKQQGGESQRSGKKRKPIFRRRKERT